MNRFWKRGILRHEESPWTPLTNNLKTFGEFIKLIGILNNLFNSDYFHLGPLFLL